jgi:hypothetical protein
MSNEIIQSVAYDNSDDFQHINIIFSQNFISLCLKVFNNETDLRVRYCKNVGIFKKIILSKNKVL